MIETLIPHTLQSALGILQSLNAKNIQLGSDRLRCSCPFGMLGKHYHSNKNLSSPAFDVNIRKNHNGTTFPQYYCHSCNEYGDLEILPYQMLLWVKNNPEEFSASNVKASAAKALNYLSDYQVEGITVPHDSVPALKAKEFIPYSDTWLTSFPTAHQNKKVAEYLYSRGLSDDTIKALDIRSYCYLDHYYACFPFRNVEGVLSGMRGRCISPESEFTDAATESRGWKLLKHRPIMPNDHESNEGLVWYREDRLDLSRPILVVEGQFDAAAIYPFYDNVTCLFTNSASPTKLSFFNGSAGVILLLDNDKDGSPAHKKIMNNRHKMGNYYTVQKTKFIQAYYPKDIKDAGECPSDILKSMVFEFINNLIEGN